MLANTNGNNIHVNIHENMDMNGHNIHVNIHENMDMNGHNR